MRESRTSVVVFSATILEKGIERERGVDQNSTETREEKTRVESETNLEGIFS